MITTKILIGAILGGILPALIWLAFWQSEDRKKPEPRRLLVRTFLLGMCAVPLVLPFQQFVHSLLPVTGILVYVIWATMEETFKFGAAYLGGLSSIEDDEPIDPMIYMITAALGFVAFENILYIIGPLLNTPLLATDIQLSINTGIMRFVGASLLHTVSSASIGLALAISFYKSNTYKHESVVVGFVVAIILHSIFNIFIVNQNQFGTFITFGMVWAGVVLLLWFFEKIKRMKALPNAKPSL